MPFTLRDIVLGGVLPFLASGLVFFFLQNNQFGRRRAACYAVGVGFVLGYFLLGLGPLVPTQHWHWLPHLLVLAGLFGPLLDREQSHWIDRALLCGIHCVFLAFLLVPAWPTLDEVRVRHWLYLGAGAWAWMMLMLPLARIQLGPLFALLLGATLVSAGVVAAASGSLRFMQLVTLAATGLFGCGATMLIFHKKASIDLGIPLIATVLCGLLYVARVNSFSEVPLYSYWLPAVAPLALWLTTFKPLAKMDPRGVGCLRLAVVLIPLGIAVYSALAAMPTEEW